MDDLEFVELNDFRVVGIDPGLAATGIWILDYYKGQYTSKGTVSRPDKKFSTVEDRLNSLLSQVFTWYTNTLEQKITNYIVIIEYPEPWRSITGDAAHHSGNVIKLSCSVGGLIHLFNTFHGECVRTVPVSAWKGNIPKTMIANRVNVWIKKHKIRKETRLWEHIYDAAGIVRWYCNEVGILEE